MNGYPNYTVSVTDNGHGNISEESNFQGDSMLSKAVSMFKRARIGNDMSYFAYACKTEGKNGISHLISALCVNCLNSIPEYSRIIDYSIIWMCIWGGLLQKLYKIKKSELLNSKVYSKV